MTSGFLICFDGLIVVLWSRFRHFPNSSFEHSEWEVKRNAKPLQCKAIASNQSWKMMSFLKSSAKVCVLLCIFRTHSVSRQRIWEYRIVIDSKQNGCFQWTWIRSEIFVLLFEFESIIWFRFGLPIIQIPFCMNGECKSWIPWNEVNQLSAWNRQEPVVDQIWSGTAGRAGRSGISGIFEPFAILTAGRAFDIWFFQGFSIYPRMQTLKSENSLFHRIEQTQNRKKWIWLEFI
jgi:hypothetical protein